MLCHEEAGDRERIQRCLDRPGAGLFFLGIGGVSLSALALWAQELGYRVAGSDREARESLHLLRQRGIPVAVGHRADNLPPDTELVVYTLAASEAVPEYQEARRRGIPMLSRAALMGHLMRRYPVRVGISGTHGKSSTTAMCASILAYACRFPTVLAGAPLDGGSSYRAGAGELLLYEACEYGDSFLHMCPTVNTVTGVEWDHPDYFADEGAVRASFLRSINGTEGVAVLNGDDAGVRALLPAVSVPCCTYGQGDGADIRYRICRRMRGCATLQLVEQGRGYSLTLRVPGDFQAANAAAAFATARACGVPAEDCLAGLRGYAGIERRMQPLPDFDGRAVLYDYAHHPTEITSAIATARQLTDGGVTVLFSPHTYSRTQALLPELCRSLSAADAVLLTEIYAAREAPLPGICAERLRDEISRSGRPCAVVTPNTAIRALRAAPRGVILLLGAGDLSAYRREMAENG